MKNIIIAIVIIILISVGTLYFIKNKNIQTSQTIEPKVTEELKKATNMKLTSTVFENNQNIPSKYTCDGENVNPPLKISDVPDDAKSLASIMDDPDAPAGTWVHWTVWNIDPKTTEIAENSVPNNAIQGTTSFGKPGYGGPCPPSDTHHYYFKLYALDTEINNLSASSSKQDLENAMTGHILEKVELVGLYSKK